MKYTLFTSLLILITVTAFSQTIHFSDSTNQWNGYFWVHETPTPLAYTASYTGDTAILSNTYRKLWVVTDSFNFEGYVREDTIARKVYARLYNDTSEYTLYDYTWALNDTVYIGEGTTLKYYISGIDSVQISGLWYRTWHGTATGISLPADSSFDIVQGLGCLHHPLWPVEYYTVEMSPVLTCFSNAGTTPAVSPEVAGYFNNTTSCSLTFTGVKNVTLAGTVSIYPNPATTELTIASPGLSGGIVSVGVYNMLGQKVLSAASQSAPAFTLDVSSLPEGMYFVRMSGGDASQGLRTMKFLKE